MMPSTVTPSTRASAPDAFETGCCPRFAPEPWRQRELTWKDKPFIKRHASALFHVPLGLRRLFADAQSRIGAADARTVPPLILADEASPWGVDYYFAVSKPIPGEPLTLLSGHYLTEVFEGPYRDVGKWFEQVRSALGAKRMHADRLLAWYTTCPRCAAAYGQNFVVVFAQLAKEMRPSDSAE